MTDQQKLEKTDQKLRAKYPDINETEYPAFREKWIQQRKKKSQLLIIIGTIMLFASMLLIRSQTVIAVCGFIGGFVISMTGACLGQYLPALPVAKDNATPSEFLTANRIAQDCAKARRFSFGWLFLFVALVLEVCLIFAQGWDYALKTWWIPVPVVILCVFFIIRARVKSSELEDELMKGDFHLICSPLADKEEEEDSTGDTTTYTHYLYFNYHTEHGRYKLKTDYKQYASAAMNQPFYVVLRKNKKGEMEPIKAYAAESNPLDNQLQAMLQRDISLTGESLSLDEQFTMLLEAAPPVPEVTPEEAEKLLPQIDTWMRKSTGWAIVTAVATVVFALLSIWMMIQVKQLEETRSWLNPQDIAWYWKLLFTLAAVAGCGIPCWLSIRYTKKVKEYEHRLAIPGHTRFGCLLMSLWMFSLFAGMFVSIMILCIWKVLT